MIRKIQIVFVLSMGVIAGVMLAQTEADFSGWMKGVAAANKGVKGGIAAKDALLVMDAAAKALGQPLPSLTAEEAQVHIDRLRASFTADDAAADALVDEHA